MFVNHLDQKIGRLADLGSNVQDIFREDNLRHLLALDGWSRKLEQQRQSFLDFDSRFVVTEFNPLRGRFEQLIRRMQTTFVRFVELLDDVVYPIEDEHAGIGQRQNAWFPTVFKLRREAKQISLDLVLIERLLNRQDPGFFDHLKSVGQEQRISSPCTTDSKAVWFHSDHLHEHQHHRADDSQLAFTVPTPNTSTQPNTTRPLSPAAKGPIFKMATSSDSLVT